MAAANATTQTEPTVGVTITAPIERDYIRRGVFPELRLDHAIRIVNGAGRYRVRLDVAEAVVADATAIVHPDSCDTPRGRKSAFTCLVKKLLQAIKDEQRKGLWDDPGLNEAKARMQESPAQFRVGEAVRLWSEWIDDENDGELMEITEAYGLYQVRSDDGPYINKDDSKLAYLWGYVVRDRMGKESFCHPFQLQSLDYGHRHLRLVA